MLNPGSGTLAECAPALRFRLRFLVAPVQQDIERSIGNAMQFQFAPSRFAAGRNQLSPVVSRIEVIANGERARKNDAIVKRQYRNAPDRRILDDVGVNDRAAHDRPDGCNLVGLSGFVRDNHHLADEWGPGRPMQFHVSFRIDETRRRTTGQAGCKLGLCCAFNSSTAAIAISRGMPKA